MYSAKSRVKATRWMSDNTGFNRVLYIFIKWAALGQLNCHKLYLICSMLLIFSRLQQSPLYTLGGNFPHSVILTVGFSR